jgi:hypothetical protein
MIIEIAGREKRSAAPAMANTHGTIHAGYVIVPHEFEFLGSEFLNGAVFIAIGAIGAL